MNSNLYLITGDESFEKIEALEKIKEGFEEGLVNGINYIVLDEETISNLESEINTYPFGYSRKLIVIRMKKKESKKKKDDEESENAETEEKENFLTEDMEQLLLSIEDVVVVFYGEIPKTSKIYKFVQKHGKTISCDKKKEYELLTWCKGIFDSSQMKISNVDINYLIETCGKDKLVLKNEIDKLISYSMTDKVINKDAIDTLCIRSSETIIFDLTDAVATKDVKRSLELLDELIEKKDPIQMIIIMITKHFKSLLVAKVATLNNRNVSDELVGKSPFACSKYLKQSKLFSQEEIVNIIRALAKVDIDYKTGLIDLRIGLESVICM